MKNIFRSIAHISKKTFYKGALISQLFFSHVSQVHAHVDNSRSLIKTELFVEDDKPKKPYNDKQAQYYITKFQNFQHEIDRDTIKVKLFENPMITIPENGEARAIFDKYYYRFSEQYPSSNTGIYQKLLPYYEMIIDAFERKRVPLQLAFITNQECGGNINALSSAGARGMWQIMPKVGERYGLSYGSDDKRLSPAHATVCAADLIRGAYGYIRKSQKIYIQTFEKVRQMYIKNEKPFTEGFQLDFVKLLKTHKFFRHYPIESFGVVDPYEDMQLMSTEQAWQMAVAAYNAGAGNVVEVLLRNRFQTELYTEYQDNTERKEYLWIILARYYAVAKKVTGRDLVLESRQEHSAKLESMREAITFHLGSEYDDISGTDTVSSYSLTLNDLRELTSGGAEYDYTPPVNSKILQKVRKKLIRVEQLLAQSQKTDRIYRQLSLLKRASVIVTQLRDQGYAEDTQRLLVRIEESMTRIQRYLS